MIARQAMLVFALCVAPAQVAGAACACSSRPECTSAGVDLTTVPLNGMHLDLCGCKVQPGFADAVPFCYVADAQACEQCELPQGCPDRVTQSSVVSGLAWRQCSLSPVLPPPALRGAAGNKAEDAAAHERDVMTQLATVAASLKKRLSDRKKVVAAALHDELTAVLKRV